jgi:hypothetical protein
MLKRLQHHCRDAATETSVGGTGDPNTILFLLPSERSALHSFNPEPPAWNCEKPGQCRGESSKPTRLSTQRYDNGQALSVGSSCWHDSSFASVLRTRPYGDKRCGPILCSISRNPMSDVMTQRRRLLKQTEDMGHNANVPCWNKPARPSWFCRR